MKNCFKETTEQLKYALKIVSKVFTRSTLSMLASFGLLIAVIIAIVIGAVHLISAVGHDPVFNAAGAGIVQFGLMGLTVTICSGLIIFFTVLIINCHKRTS